MIVEGVLCLLGIGLTIPQVVAESSRFEVESFNTWIQFLPQFLLIIALVLKSFKKTAVACLVFGGLALLGVYFLLIFNSQSSSYVICSKFSSICAEVDDILCVGNVLETWEALLYLIGLCLCIIGITILMKTTITAYNSAKVTAVEKLDMK
jgi:uncharacterized membrane protein